MRAVDTNVLVRLIARDDSRQLVEAENFVAEGAWVSLLVLAEAIWVLGAIYGLSPQEQITSIQMLLDHRKIVLEQREVVVEAVRLFDARHALGFSDCLVIESARKAGHLPLGTFNRALARVSGAQKL